MSQTGVRWCLHSEDHKAPTSWWKIKQEDSTMWQTTKSVGVVVIRWPSREWSEQTSRTTPLGRELAKAAVAYQGHTKVYYGGVLHPTNKTWRHFDVCVSRYINYGCSGLQFHRRIASFPVKTSPELPGEWICSLGTLPATPKIFTNCNMDFDVPPHLLPWH